MITKHTLHGCLFEFDAGFLDDARDLVGLVANQIAQLLWCAALRPADQLGAPRKARR